MQYCLVIARRDLRNRLPLGIPCYCQVRIPREMVWKGALFECWAPYMAFSASLVWRGALLQPSKYTEVQVTLLTFIGIGGATVFSVVFVWSRMVFFLKSLSS